MARYAVTGFVLAFTAGCGGSIAAPSRTAVAPEAPLFAVSGAVYDTLSRPIAQARVEVIDGPQRGLIAITNDLGEYAFDPVFTGTVLLRAFKPGYREHFLTFRNAQAQRLFFRLDSANESVNLNGTYELTFTASDECASIPGYARRRVYDANSSGTSALYLINLSGGGYGLSPGSSYFSNVLYAGVFEDTAQVNFSDPPIWERFPQGSYLVIVGAAQGPISSLPAALPMWGWFVYCAEMSPGDSPRCAVPEVSCRSSSHLLNIARRP